MTLTHDSIFPFGETLSLSLCLASLDDSVLSVFTGLEVSVCPGLELSVCPASVLFVCPASVLSICPGLPWPLSASRALSSASEYRLSSVSTLQVRPSPNSPSDGTFRSFSFQLQVSSNALEHFLRSDGDPLLLSILSISSPGGGASLQICSVRNVLPTLLS